MCQWNKSIALVVDVLCDSVPVVFRINEQSPGALSEITDPKHGIRAA